MRFVLAALLFPLTSLAQVEEGPAVTSLHKIYFLNPAYEWEGRLTSKATASLQAGLGFSLSATSNPTTGFQFNWTMFAVGHATYRYYYNLDRRQRLGRFTRGNSGNFFTAGLLWNTSSVAGENLTSAAGLHPMVGWGIQRTYRKNFNLTLVLGGAQFNFLNSNTQRSGLSGLLQFKLGYTFMPKKQS